MAIRNQRSKLEQAILFIARETEHDRTFGSTKLNKALFRADFRAYLYLGEPITGYRYQALKDGPTLVAMRPVLRDMEHNDAITLVRPPAGEVGEHRVIPRRAPDVSQLTVVEVSYLLDGIRRVQPMTAEQASEYSHTFPGWQHAWKRGSGTRIPLESVFWKRKPAFTPEDETYAQELARDFGLSSE